MLRDVATVHFHCCIVFHHGTVTYCLYTFSYGHSIAKKQKQKNPHTQKNKNTPNWKAFFPGTLKIMLLRNHLCIYSGILVSELLYIHT